MPFVRLSPLILLVAALTTCADPTSDPPADATSDAKPERDAGPSAAHAPSPPVHVLTQGDVAFEVTVIDGAIGAPLSGSAVTLTDAPSDASRSRRATPDGASRVALRVDVVAPQGYVDVSETFDVDVPHLATRVATTIAVQPVARVRLRALGVDGHPVAGARVRTARVDGIVAPKATGPTGADGATDVRGLPWFRGARVEFVVVADDGTAGRVRGRLAGAETTIDLHVDLAPPQDVSFAGRSGSGTRLVACRPGPERAAGAWGDLDVVVLRRDGRPLPGARVVVDAVRPLPDPATDAAGRVRLGAVVAGPRTVRVDWPGVLPLRAAIDVTPDGVTELVLRESEGRRLEVMVTDSRGIALPAARVRVQTEHGVALADGDMHVVERCTDADGRVAIPHVTDDAVTLEVRYGGRAVRVDVAAGVTSVAAVVPDA